MIAFFPGRFQPPHLGHVLTIMRLLPEYSVFIIGITEDGLVDKNTAEKIRSLFSDFFARIVLPYKTRVEILTIPGVLTQYKTKKDMNKLPKFDILLSGNPKVIEWAQLHGFPSKFVPRAEGVFCSGTEIRGAFKEPLGK
ncbi:TPA: hypothetical protein HA278_04870 [Candidatus Woesearchaeota archaeon]|nr:hypothetical protein [Candidatus Woesearchaeota archaeon]|tara:strand:- start:32 stop:448 length:417 start_codon:yes stop_codon:yes gene_type:complete